MSAIKGSFFWKTIGRVLQAYAIEQANEACSEKEYSRNGILFSFKNV